MNVATNSIPVSTIEAIARNLFRETVLYGFKQVDYLRFVNILLDMSIKNGCEIEKVSRKEAVNDYELKLDFPLIGEKVQVRRFEKDADRYFLEKWLANDEGKHFLISGIRGKILDIDILIKNEQNILGMIIAKQAEETPVGLLAYFNYDKIQQQAELRQLIGEATHPGKGLAKEATKLWIQFGVTNLGLKKIYLSTLNTNIRNIKLNEDLGFKVEGILRKECFIDGKHYDVLKMGYLIK